MKESRSIHVWVRVLLIAVRQARGIRGVRDMGRGVVVRVFLLL